MTSGISRIPTSIIVLSLNANERPDVPTLAAGPIGKSRLTVRPCLGCLASAIGGKICHEPGPAMGRAASWPVKV